MIIPPKNLNAAGRFLENIFETGQFPERFHSNKVDATRNAQRITKMVRFFFSSSVFFSEGKKKKYRCEGVVPFFVVVKYLESVILDPNCRFSWMRGWETHQWNLCWPGATGKSGSASEGKETEFLSSAEQTETTRKHSPFQFHIQRQVSKKKYPHWHDATFIGHAVPLPPITDNSVKSALQEFWSVQRTSVDTSLVRINANSCCLQCIP